MTDIVLIHGAYQGGWIWGPVAERLRAAGHRVFAPTLDGCAERKHQIRAGIDTESHGEEIANLLYFENLEDTVLVGASSGGMVMAAAAERAQDRVGRVVYADALALMDGERIRDVVKGPAAIETDMAVGPSREYAMERLFAGLEPAQRDWAADRMTLHPRDVFYKPVRLPSFWSGTWDADVLYCAEAQNPGEPHIRRCRDALDARWHVLQTGHYPMLSTPDALVDIILRR